ncbi:hypothetical protein D3C76_1667870 [compost metagenome]
MGVQQMFGRQERPHRERYGKDGKDLASGYRPFNARSRAALMSLAADLQQMDIISKDSRDD